MLSYHDWNPLPFPYPPPSSSPPQILSAPFVAEPFPLQASYISSASSAEPSPLLPSDFPPLTSSHLASVQQIHYPLSAATSPSSLHPQIPPSASLSQIPNTTHLSGSFSILNSDFPALNLSSSLQLDPGQLLSSRYQRPPPLTHPQQTSATPVPPCPAGLGLPSLVWDGVQLELLQKVGPCFPCGPLFHFHPLLASSLQTSVPLALFFLLAITKILTPGLINYPRTSPWKSLKKFLLLS